jgi:hypothetical protein
MFSASAISSMVAKSPVSSSFRHRKPRARALRSTLSTRALVIGVVVMVSGLMRAYSYRILRCPCDAAKMGLRRSAASMLEANEGFRRLKAHKHLPLLKAALQNHRTSQSATQAVDDFTYAA